MLQCTRCWRSSYATANHQPYASEADLIFPSLKADGQVPVSGSIFVADHLRTAAKTAGVQIAQSQRFGWHNLRHSLSHWLVSTALVDAKTVQGILRHSRIQTTLDLDTQENSDQTETHKDVSSKPWAGLCHNSVMWVDLWVAPFG